MLPDSRALIGSLSSTPSAPFSGPAPIEFEIEKLKCLLAPPVIIGSPHGSEDFCPAPRQASVETSPGGTAHGVRSSHMVCNIPTGPIPLRHRYSRTSFAATPPPPTIWRDATARPCWINGANLCSSDLPKHWKSSRIHPPGRLFRPPCRSCSPISSHLAAFPPFPGPGSLPPPPFSILRLFP